VILYVVHCVAELMNKIETLLKRLEIEKRVQFGAERMLHVGFK
jgi:hypothetical protein